MQLLFNKGGSGGATEIKRLLGFTDSDIKWEHIKPKVIPATDIVIDLIGQPIYDSLVGIYNASSPSENDTEFLERVQTVIMLDAYRNLAMSNNLAHTVNGRKNRVEDKEKIAFEWQIVNDNQKMERDYYRALDRLIKYMDANVSGWKATNAYKATHDLFIRTAAEIDDYSHIDGSRLLFLKLSPGIRKAELEHVKPRITEPRFNELKNKLKNNTNDHDAALLKLIQEVVVYKALAWGIPRLSAQLFPEGFLEVGDVSRLTISARKKVEKMQAEAYAQRYEQDFKDACARLEEYMRQLTEVPVLPENVQPIKPNFDPNDKFVDC